MVDNITTMQWKDIMPNPQRWCKMFERLMEEPWGSVDADDSFISTANDLMLIQKENVFV